MLRIKKESQAVFKLKAKSKVFHWIASLSLRRRGAVVVVVALRHRHLTLVPVLHVLVDLHEIQKIHENLIFQRESHLDSEFTKSAKSMFSKSLPLPECYPIRKSFSGERKPTCIQPNYISRRKYVTWRNLMWLHNVLWVLSYLWESSESP